VPEVPGAKDNKEENSDNPAASLIMSVSIQNPV